MFAGIGEGRALTGWACLLSYLLAIVHWNPWSALPKISPHTHNPTEEVKILKNFLICLTFLRINIVCKYITCTTFIYTIFTTYYTCKVNLFFVYFLDGLEYDGQPLLMTPILYLWLPES
jgi:hypothetical protein